MLRISPGSCYWVRGQCNCSSLSSLFLCLFFLCSLTELDYLQQQGNNIRQQQHLMLQNLWLSGSCLKCKTALKSDSKNGIMGFHAYNLSMISISTVLSLQRKGGIFFLSASSNFFLSTHHHHNKVSARQTEPSVASTQPKCLQFRSLVTSAQF